MNQAQQGVLVGTGNDIAPLNTIDSYALQREVYPVLIPRWHYGSLIQEVRAMGIEREAVSRLINHFEQTPLLATAIVGSSVVSGGNVVVTLAAASVKLVGGQYRSYFQELNVVSTGGRIHGVVTATNQPTGSNTHTLTLTPQGTTTAAQLLAAFPANATMIYMGSIANSEVGLVAGVQRSYDRYQAQWGFYKEATPVARGTNDRGTKRTFKYKNKDHEYDLMKVDTLERYEVTEALAIAFGSGGAAEHPTYGTVQETDGYAPIAMTYGVQRSFDFNNITVAILNDLDAATQDYQLGSRVRFRGTSDPQNKLRASLHALNAGPTNVEFQYWDEYDGSEGLKTLNMNGVAMANSTFWFGIAGEFMLPNHINATNGEYTNVLIGIPEGMTVSYEAGGSYQNRVPTWEICYFRGSEDFGSGRYWESNLKPEHFNTADKRAFACASEIANVFHDISRFIVCTNTGA